jgi:hypothetical protein
LRYESKPLDILCFLHEAGGNAGCVSKRGVDDGNQKGGGFLQPAQESRCYYSTGKVKVKIKMKNSGNFFS